MASSSVSATLIVSASWLRSALTLPKRTSRRSPTSAPWRACCLLVIRYWWGHYAFGANHLARCHICNENMASWKQPMGAVGLTPSVRKAVDAHELAKHPGVLLIDVDTGRDTTAAA